MKKTLLVVWMEAERHQINSSTQKRTIGDDGSCGSVFFWTYLVEIITSWKPVQTMAKKSSKFIKIITYIDDMMTHNLVKYLVQTRLRLWDIKIINFKSESCPDDLLEICYFYIKQMKSNLDKIFYKVVYHLHVWFLVNLDDFFTMTYTNLHEGYSLH